MDEHPTGRVLGGRYELLEVVGEGGMATVYRAHDAALDRLVAVKLLKPHLAEDGAFRARFEREARVAAGLNHPHLVAVYDTGSEGRDEFFVMEFVRGRSLGEIVDAEGPLEVVTALGVAADAAAALQVVHDAGLVHRDVSPRNVLLTRDGVVKLTDFGIAHTVDEQTLGKGDVLGTASYLSPEQASGAEVDGRTDVYGLGCVLYAALTGRPPFVGDSVAAVLAQHLHDRPQPPSSIRPGIPAAVDAAVLTALAKQPGERYQSAAELRQALVSAGGRAGDPAEGQTGRLRRLAGGAVLGGSALGGTAAAGAAPVGAPVSAGGEARTVIAPAAGGRGPLGHRGLLVAGIAVAAALATAFIAFGVDGAKLGARPVPRQTAPPAASSPSPSPSQDVVPSHDKTPPGRVKAGKPSKPGKGKGAGASGGRSIPTPSPTPTPTPTGTPPTPAPAAT